MRPDTATHLAAAARQRHELARAKAIRALRELDRAGTATTFEAVARAASVSRSWLYTQPDIRGEIQRLRYATRRALSLPIPAAQRATVESLRRRLETTNERIRQLAEDNRECPAPTGCRGSPRLCRAGRGQEWRLRTWTGSRWCFSTSTRVLIGRRGEARPSRRHRLCAQRRRAEQSVPRVRRPANASIVGGPG
jgi:hypothetical protein